MHSQPPRPATTTPTASALAIATAIACGLAPGSAAAQASFDVQTQVLTVPTIDVGGQVYRNLSARLDPDGDRR